MSVWKPEEVAEKDMRDIQRDFFDYFSSRTTNEEKEIMGERGPEQVTFFLGEDKLHVRISLYESLHGEYLSGEKELALYPSEHESAQFLQSMTDARRRILASALTGPSYPKESDEERRRKIADVLRLMSVVSPHGVQDEDITIVTNDQIIKNLRAMYEKIISADKQFLYSPESPPNDRQVTPGDVLTVSDVILTQIDLLSEFEADRQQTKWLTEKNITFTPHEDTEHVAVDFCMSKEIHRVFPHSVETGYIVVTVVQQENRLFQRIVNKLFPEQRETIAKQIGSINVETIQTKYLAGALSIPDTIQFRSNLLRRIRTGTLFDGKLSEQV